MHQTTVRFSSQLWDELRRTADREGISVAQYLRDAAVIRMTYEAAGGERTARDEPARTASPASSGDRLASLREEIRDTRSESSAVWAQGEHARARASALREQSAEARSRRGAEFPAAAISPDSHRTGR